MRLHPLAQFACSSSRFLPSSSICAACRWRSYSSRSTGRQQGPEAALDLVFDARPRAVAEDRVGAGAQRKDFADDVDGLAQSVGRAERAEVAAAVLDDAAGDGDSRPGVIGDLGAQVRFVVLQADVVARLVLLDQVVFEDQRFFFTARDQRVEIAHAAASGSAPGSGRRRRRENTSAPAGAATWPCRHRGPCRACPSAGRRRARRT